MSVLSDIECERQLLRYVEALDRGDADVVASVLEAALGDPKLDRAVSEVDRALLEEAGLPSAVDVQTVKEVAERTLGQATADADSSTVPVTAGDVAAQLKSTGRIPSGEEDSNERVLRKDDPIPDALTLNAAFRFLEKVGEEVSEMYARAFREAALWMRTGRSAHQVKMAAREERRPYTKSGDEDEKDGADQDSK